MQGVSLTEKLDKIRQEIYNSAVKAGRKAADIKIVAVTKNVTVERIAEAVRGGVYDLGENRVQELLSKQPHLGPGVRWHLIGHLQTNKVRAVVGKTVLIHSLDSWRLAVELDGRSTERGIVTDVLVQVNVSGEDTKYGLSVRETADFIKEVSGLSGISVRGLMTIAPQVSDPEQVRPVFRELRSLYDNIKSREIPRVSMDFISMGMTNDYRVAVEEGANILRIGTGIFGER
ncbi:MAG: YggS family pyridoxal phosphate-dependent enzyme [Bacillota bacterium]